MGSENAAVFPVPVWALPMTSRPSRMSGIARSWIGVGSTKPMALTPLTIPSDNPKLAKPISRRRVHLRSVRIFWWRWLGWSRLFHRFFAGPHDIGGDAGNRFLGRTRLHMHVAFR